MGGCASVPKEFLKGNAEQAPAKPEPQPEPETSTPAADAPEEKTDGDDKKVEEKEAPLVDVAEPQKEEAHEVAADKPAVEVTAETKVEVHSDKDKTEAPIVTV